MLKSQKREVASMDRGRQEVVSGGRVVGVDKKEVERIIGIAISCMS